MILTLANHSGWMPLSQNLSAMQRPGFLRTTLWKTLNLISWKSTLLKNRTFPHGYFTATMIVLRTMVSRLTIVLSTKSLPVCLIHQQCRRNCCIQRFHVPLHRNPDICICQFCNPLA